MWLEHRLSALLQRHLHSRLHTWFQWIGQRQMQDEMRNIKVLWFGATYIRGLTVYNIISLFSTRIKWEEFIKKMFVWFDGHWCKIVYYVVTFVSGVHGWLTLGAPLTISKSAKLICLGLPVTCYNHNFELKYYSAKKEMYSLSYLNLVVNSFSTSYTTIIIVDF